ncbi:hypothetical protein BFW38_07700 [Terasakiispira papahanaumokuakeensis]|uniref:Diguanylate cyclase n=1 Tax=Terasakiispira papahanaumokuakeensis TaxID=197479 RepID=A0A1E2V8W4_9GAMM|nr:EAL domain-containing protein [Terasakiispira papahanaumokuakeensis]ODC03450.1 hypothetical protein BFW38_07700 [Terasakiispira papahanaumokuakeensis]
MKKPSLKLAITLPYVLSLLIILGSFALLWRLDQDDMIERQSNKLLNAMQATLHERLNNVLDAPMQLARFQASEIISNKLYQFDTLSQLEIFNRRLYQATAPGIPQVSALAYADLERRIVGQRRNGQDEAASLILQDQRTNNQLTIYAGPTQQNPIIKRSKDYDVRQRPFLKPLIDNPVPQWTQLYVNEDEKHAATVSAIYPISVNDRLIGTSIVDVGLKGISDFLQQESAQTGGIFIILDSMGQLIASVSPEDVILSTPAIERIIKAAEANTEKTNFKLKNIETTPAQWRGHVTHYHHAYNLDWTLITALPEKLLRGDSRRNQNLSLIALVGIGLATLLIGLFFIRRLIQPIMETANAARQISSRNWEHHVHSSRGLTQETTTLVEAFSEMSGQLRTAFDDMRYTLQYDQLTGLLSMQGLKEEALEHAEHDPGTWSLALLSLEHFRIINDSMGRGIGDRLLCAVAERLQQHAGIDCLVARLDGADFAILYPPSLSGQMDEHVETLMHLVAGTPYDIQQEEVILKANLGWTQRDLPRCNLDDLLRFASIALNRTKAIPDLHIMRFRSEMVESLVEETRLAAELSRAAADDELLTWYQPIVDLHTFKMVGAEALMRWHSQVRGMVSPAQFIPVAEQSSLILTLGEWILNDACQKLTQTPLTHQQDFRLHVNLSARQVLQSDLVDTIEDTIARTGLSPTKLTLEVTESVLLDQNRETLRKLETLRRQGMHISLDDFGTGYSSLAYLHRLPVDSLKIDQSFIREMRDSASSQAIVRAIIAMAEGVGVEVVAEGVETLEQAEWLRKMGCQMAQGFFFAKPGDIQQLKQMANTPLPLKTHAIKP